MPVRSDGGDVALGTVTACISAGILVDKIFEPLMQSLQMAMRIFNPIVGAGKGSGMAVIFLLTGILGVVLSLIYKNNVYIKKSDDLT